MKVSLIEIESLSLRALLAHGASEEQAGPLARAIAAAEADGIRSHGLMYLSIYCEHLRCGKVIGSAIPQVSQPKPAAILVDAGSGFAHPAIAKGCQSCWTQPAAKAWRRSPSTIPIIAAFSAITPRPLPARVWWPLALPMPPRPSPPLAGANLSWAPIHGLWLCRWQRRRAFCH